MQAIDSAVFPLFFESNVQLWDWFAQSQVVMNDFVWAPLDEMQLIKQLENYWLCDTAMQCVCESTHASVKQPCWSNFFDGQLNMNYSNFKTSKRRMCYMFRSAAVRRTHIVLVQPARPSVWLRLCDRQAGQEDSTKVQKPETIIVHRRLEERTQLASDDIGRETQELHWHIRERSRSSTSVWLLLVVDSRVFSKDELQLLEDRHCQSDKQIPNTFSIIYQ